MEPSGGLTGLSPGPDSETDFCESTVARSYNPDRKAGQSCSAPQPPWPCPQATYLDPFGARVQGVAPAASCTGPGAQAATAVPTCRHREPRWPVLAWPKRGVASRKYCRPDLQNSPTYLQKASSAPRSPRGARRALMNCPPVMGLAQHLLGNL